MENVYQALLLIVTAFSLIYCHCPMNETERPTNCSFSIHCYGTIRNIILPYYCRGSINVQKSVELTISQAIDRFDENIDREFLNSITSLAASGNWPRTNLTFLNHMNQLKKLVLTRNNIQTIENPSPFLFLANLEYLDLSYNRLTEINDLLEFETIPKLFTYLSLAHNDIKELPGDAFVYLNSLRELDLSFNQISDLSEEPFNNLTMLHTLNLENNLITNLYGTLNNLDSLVNLFLSDNQIHKIDEITVSRILHLKSFDISANRLNRLNSTLLLRHWGRIDGVCKIRLSHNWITFLPNGTKDIFEIHSKDLTENKFKVKTELDLSRNSISNIGYNAFLYVVQLVSLDLSHNQLKDFFVNHRDLIHVRHLNLSNNRIANISSHFSSTLFNMRSLETLDISNNNLRNIPYYVFTHMYNLVHVNMANNQLQHGIDVKLTMNNRSKKSILILNSNNISEASVINLAYTMGLQSLEIRKNQIEKLNATSLRLPVSLISLNMSENKIKEIGPSTFHVMRYLKYLNVSNNQLETIQYGAFEGLTALTSLDLSNNKITNLDSRFLMDLKSLAFLYLRSNGLLDIDYKAWLGHTFVLKVYLDDNNFSCTWLGKALTDYNNGYSKMKPFVDSMLLGPSIEGIPCREKNTEVEDLTDADKSKPVLTDERLLVINQKILETLKEQSYFLRAIFHQRHLTLSGTEEIFRELRNVRKSN